MVSRAFSNLRRAVYLLNEYQSCKLVCKCKAGQAQQNGRLDPRWWRLQLVRKTFSCTGGGADKDKNVHELYALRTNDAYMNQIAQAYILCITYRLLLQISVDCHLLQSNQKSQSQASRLIVSFPVDLGVQWEPPLYSRPELLL